MSTANGSSNGPRDGLEDTFTKVFAEVLEIQGGCCAICAMPHGETATPFRLDHSIDDDGDVCFRGVLCLDCQTLVMTLEGNPGQIEKAIAYLDDGSYRDADDDDLSFETDEA